MKIRLTIFAFLCLVAFTACEEDELLRSRCGEVFGEVEATAFALVELPITSLSDGMYLASIADKRIAVVVEQGNVRWLMPKLEAGTHTLRIKSQGTPHKALVHVKAQEESRDVYARLIDLNEELKLGLSADKIQALSIEEQQELVQFISANETHIAAEQKQRKLQEMERTSAFYYPLAINESVTIDVASADYWNGSGVFVTAGQVFQITAEGTWKDWYINTDANGYSNWYLSLFTVLKRAKAENWFKLIASVNKDKNYPIGKTATIRPTASGPLDFYANDANGFYWNNYGSIRVTVTRVQ